jgi:hypothetical protein
MKFNRCTYCVKNIYSQKLIRCSGGFVIIYGSLLTFDKRSKIVNFLKNQKFYDERLKRYYQQKYGKNSN